MSINYMKSELNYGEACGEATKISMRRDPKVLVYGLGVDDPKGMYGTTMGLVDEFGKDNSDIICIGKKAFSYFKNRDFKSVKNYVDFWNDLNYEYAIEMGNDIIARFKDEEVDQVQVIYNKFINVAKQEIQNDIFLPMIRDNHDEKNDSYHPERLFEPSKEQVVKSIIPRFLNTKIWQYLLESNASEQAARMLAMENATSNANDMIKDLTLQFNKARQTAITTEMLEIVSGAEALS